MPYRIKSISEIHKTSIDLFVVTMNLFIYQCSECKNMHGMPCGYSLKCQSETCEVCLKKQHNQGAFGLR